MKNITVSNKLTKIEYKYLQLTSIEDIKSYIDFDIDFSETREVIDDIISKRNVINKKYDGIKHLSNMNNRINDMFSVNLATSRKDILMQKKNNMIKLFEKYGEIWINKVGVYSNPLSNLEIME